MSTVCTKCHIARKLNGTMYSGVCVHYKKQQKELERKQSQKHSPTKKT